MSLFSRLLGGGPTSSTTPETSDSRDLASPNPASTALEHDDRAARIAAIDVLEFGDALMELSGLTGATPAPESIKRAAQQRLATLIDSGAAPLAAIRERSANCVALLAVAARTGDTGLVQRVLAEIEDEDVLADLATQGSSPEIRRQAAERVRNPATVARLLKLARGRDNNIYRILKTKRDAQLGAERAVAESLKRAAALCATIEHHEHRPFTEGFAAALDHYQAQWQELQAQAPEDLQRRADSAIDRCRQVIAHHRQRAAQQEEQQAARAAALLEAESERRRLLALLRDLLTSLYEGPIADLETTLATLQTRWSELRALASPAGDEQHRFDQLRDAITSLAALIALHGSVRQQAANLTDEGIDPLKQCLIHSPLLGEQIPAAAREASEALQAREQAHLERLQSQELLLGQVVALLRRAQNALNAGQSRQAAGMRRSVEPKLRALAELPPRLQLQLQTFDAQLDVLQDWRNFAVAPKRGELIARMEALVGSIEAPVLLAKRIQKLQDEWKLISKGSTEDTDAEWQRFHDAGQKAYAPCGEYFAEQARLRAENLQRRDALLVRLQEFSAAQDWEHPDWREIARALRESRQQWRDFQPVVRSANRPVQVAFDAAVLALQSRLDAEYARNADAMSALIARARALLEMGDARQAFEEIRGLQLQWKEIGLVPQEQRARLWEDFRQQCDAAYARQRALQAEQHALVEASARTASEICEQAERLLTIPDAELIESAGKTSELRAAFAALGPPTADASRRLLARFERALDQFEKRLAGKHADDRARAWDLVLDAAGRIRDWRLAVATGATPAACATLHEAAQRFIADVPRWPKGVQQALQAALGSAGSPDIAANEVQLRTLCIRNELLSGLPTPSVDQDLRRQFQLQQLLKGLGQKLHSAEGGSEALTLEWIAVGATSDAVYAQLLPRAPRPSLLR